MNELNSFQVKELQHAIASHDWDYKMAVKFGDAKYLSLSRKTLVMILEYAKENETL